MKKAIILSVCGLLFAGCVAYTKYGNIKPVSPKPHSESPNTPADVDSLCPVFRWQNKSPDQKVDLGIWEALKIQSGSGEFFTYVKGEMVYYKQGISGQEKTLEKKLMPNTAYFWSVKPSGTGDWATANFHEFYVVPGSYSKSVDAEKLYFLFKTPENSKH